MFRFIKNLFGDTPVTESVPKSSKPAASEDEKGSTPPAPEAPPAAAPSSIAVPCLEIPLQPIIERLSPTLRARMHRPPARAEVLKLSLTTALEQLPRGAVRIPFRELRQGVSSDLFSTDPGVDEALVDVPLGEVLSRLQPDLLARRQGQKRVSIPEMVPSVFASRQAGVSPKIVKAALPSISAEHDDAASSRMMAASRPEGTGAKIAMPGGLGLPAAGVGVNGMNSHVQPTPAAAAPLPVVSPERNTLSEPEPVKISFHSIAANWPEPIRSEVMSAYRRDSVNIPFGQLEGALKHGKAVFTWKQLRWWASPKPITALAEHDSVSLELPLSVLAPLFLAQRSTVAHSKKLEAHCEIPDLFPGPKPKEAAAALGPIAPSVRFEPPSGEQRTSGTGTSALPHQRISGIQPGFAAHAAAPQPLTTVLPADLVRRACQLSGVTGALLATADGFVIASQLPPGINAEVAAGFLPRMCSRLGEYTRELKLGEPAQVEILAGNVPLHVIKMSSAYFAVLGKAAEPLPKVQLTVLAGQLSHQTH